MKLRIFVSHTLFYRLSTTRVVFRFSGSDERSDVPLASDASNGHLRLEGGGVISAPPSSLITL